MTNMLKKHPTVFSGNRRTRLPAPEPLSSPARFFVGKSIKIHIKERDTEKQIQDFFSACQEDGTLEKLHAICSPEEGLVGLNSRFTEKEYQYAIAVLVREETPVSGGLERFVLDEGDFVQFMSDGISCHDAWREIYNEWLPNAPYRYRMAQEIEFYGGRAPLFAQTLWVPVQWKEELPQPEEKQAARLLSGEFICSALCAVVGLFLAFDCGNPWLGLLLGYAAGWLLYNLSKRFRKKRVQEHRG